MRIHFGLGALRPEWPRAVACIGTFDGVHVGHQAVIRQAVAIARERELPSVLITFDRHPAAILAPDRCPPAVADLRRNLECMEALGVSVALVLAFDAALSRTSAQGFLETVLQQGARAECVVVGHDFAMGNGREGTAAWLGERIETVVVPPETLGGERVSSTRVRELVAAGEVARAEHLLGKPFRLSGVVVGGQRLGRTLGYPTANVARSVDQILPADGVYAVDAHTPHGRFPAALAIGTRPAVGGGARTVEAYLIDYPGHSLYGMPIDLDLRERLREERNFPSLDALVAQMAQDVAEAARILGSRPTSNQV